MAISKKVFLMVCTILLCFTALPVRVQAANPTYVNGIKYINIDSDDVVLLERLVVAEAGNQSFEAQKGVAIVVINRCLSSDFPDNVDEVINQKQTVNGKTIYQFSCVQDGNYKKAKGREEEAESAVLAAIKEFQDGKAMLPRNVLYFRSDYYFNWKTVEDYVCYDDMYFSAVKEA